MTIQIQNDSNIFKLHYEFVHVTENQVQIEFPEVSVPGAILEPSQASDNDFQASETFQGERPWPQRVGATLLAAASCNATCNMNKFCVAILQW